MVTVGAVPTRLPPREQLRNTLGPGADIALLRNYLQVAEKQPQGRANGLRILLQVCTEAGNDRFVGELLRQGADVDSSNKKSMPPLLYAARAGHVSALQILLTHGADVDGIDNAGRTALMLAAVSGHTELVKIFLDSQADISILDKEQRDALIHASSSGHADIVKLLLNAGADPTVLDRKKKKNATIYAAENGNGSVLKLLLERSVNIDCLDEDGRTPAIHAAMSGHESVLRILLEHGADLSIKDKDDKSAVIYAAANCDVTILELILKQRIDFRRATAEGKSILAHAILNTKYRDKGIDDNKTNDERRAEVQDKVNLKIKVVTMLLDAGFDIREKSHSVEYLKLAALNGENEVLKCLLRRKARVNAVDEHGRSVLLHLASDITKPRKWDEETVRIIISAGANVDLFDDDQHTHRRRRALEWASAAGNELVAKHILGCVEPSRTSKYVNHVHKTNRGKAAIHLAAQNGHHEIVKRLLNHDAVVDAASEGGWTPLLISAKAGHTDVVNTLLAASQPADVNATTSSGLTALHLAAEYGHKDIVQRLLQVKGIYTNPKDAFNTTPLLRAGQHLHNDDRPQYKEIVNLLKAHIFCKPTSENAVAACDQFSASIVDFYLDPGEDESAVRSNVRRMPVRQVLYELDDKDNSKFAITTRIDEVRRGSPTFRWIHLPANNIAWVEILITKMFVEGGPMDITGFQSMLEFLDQEQHSGPKIHSRFLRPGCHLHVGDTRPKHLQFLKRRMKDIGRVPTRSSTMSTIESQTEAPQQSTGAVYAPHTPHAPLKTASTLLDSSDTTPSKHRSHPQSAANSIGLLFMPYLHWESDSSRQMTRNIVEQMKVKRTPESRTGMSRDECLIRGYLFDSTNLHLRRTLDQYKHHSINTDKRDRDQVVYRHQRKERTPDPNIFMVDQLWVFLFKGIIITCFPERWEQQTRSPLNLFDGVIQDITSKAFPPVRSVRDLATAITNRCIGSFDRHDKGHPDANYKFFEIFGQSIGRLTNKATTVLEQFQRDSTKAAAWLRAREESYRRLFHHSDRQGENDADDSDTEEDLWPEQGQDTHLQESGRNPSFVTRLLDISKETRLLVECKDIEEELAILTSVLEQQRDVSNNIRDIWKESAFAAVKPTPVLNNVNEAKKKDVNSDVKSEPLAQGHFDRWNLSGLTKVHQNKRSQRKDIGLQIRLINQHLADIERMRKQMNGINDSLVQVLDLKQKHANAIEARFARDQAADTARQGQTIMVFTVVTIVFLPLSFMASFFAISISEFPYRSSKGGINALPLAWVSKYLFGIGLAVTVPLIILAFLVGDFRGRTSWWRRWWFRYFVEPTNKSPQTTRKSRIAEKSIPAVVMTASAVDSEHIYSRKRSMLTRTWTGLTDHTQDHENHDYA